MTTIAKESLINLWRFHQPVVLPKAAGADDDIKGEFIFPSGRQGIYQAMAKAGLGRADRIALPEWMPHCVVSAVGMVSSIIPIQEVLKYQIPVKAVLLYEQWGWPFKASVRDDILKHFGSSVIVMDRVDSADIDNKNRMSFIEETTQIDVISLSKLLGLRGGGLTKLNGEYIEFQPRVAPEFLSDYFWGDGIDPRAETWISHIDKNYANVIPGEVEQWLEENDLTASIGVEAAHRRKNLKLIMESQFAEHWPNWMIQAYEAGAAPGIVPLRVQSSDFDPQNICGRNAEKFGIRGVQYNFNWSGNPLYPEFDVCVAFPIHGLVNDLDGMMKELENLFT